VPSFHKKAVYLFYLPDFKKKVASHHTTTPLKESSAILEITLMEQEHINGITLWQSHC